MALSQYFINVEESSNKNVEEYINVEESSNNKSSPQAGHYTPVASNKM